MLDNLNYFSRNKFRSGESPRVLEIINEEICLGDQALIVYIGNPWDVTRESMNIVIPAAGIGTRLRPHTHTIPKSLLHVAGKAILGHILDNVIKLNPDEIIIVTGFLGEKIREYVHEHYRVPARFVEQEEPLGLGAAVSLALGLTDDRPVLIVLGDTIIETDMEDFVSAGRNVLGVLPVEDPGRFGIASMNNGVVTRLVEKPDKPDSNMAIIGLYYIGDTAKLRSSLTRLLESDMRTRGEYQLTDALQMMIDDGVEFVGHPVDGWYDCGKRETLISTNKHLLEKINPRHAREGSVVVPPTFIASTAVVESSVIGPFVSISDGAVVKNSIIKNSIIGYEAEVRDATLHNSLIGHRAVVFGEYRAINVGDSSEIGYY
jgi:glucose-1-phosphate thymidylyltransferase